MTPATIWRLWGKRPFPGLSKALTADRSAAVRKVAAEVPGNLGDTPSVSLLTNVLRADTDAEVRHAAARSLAAIGAPMILRVAIQAFQQETNHLVRGELVSLLDTTWPKSIRRQVQSGARPPLPSTM